MYETSTIKEANMRCTRGPRQYNKRPELDAGQMGEYFLCGISQPGGGGGQDAFEQWRL